MGPSSSYMLRIIGMVGRDPHPTTLIVEQLGPTSYTNRWPLLAPTSFR